MPQGRKTGILPYGEGCKLYSDCFTCPCPESKGCVWPAGGTKKMRDTAISQWKPYFERELSKLVTIGGKG